MSLKALTTAMGEGSPTVAAYLDRYGSWMTERAAERVAWAHYTTLDYLRTEHQETDGRALPERDGRVHVASVFAALGY